MKRVLASIFALAIALPAAAQENTQAEGPSEDAIQDLLDLLDEGETCEGEDCDVDASEDDGTPDTSEDSEAVTGESPDAAAEGDVENGEEPAADEAADEDASEAAESTGAEAASEDVTETEPHAITTSAPFLTSSEYAALRDHEEVDVLRLEWRVETFTSSGLRSGEPATRILYLAPGYVREENGNAVSVYDFARNRHLTLDLAAQTMTNIAFEAEVRRRTDTYLGLSQAGRLEQIPLGPDRSFDRFWLEAAMGIRREPVELQTGYASGELTVTRGDGPTLLAASFDVEDTAASGEDNADTDDTGEDASEDEMDAILAMATPIDLSSGESVVFDPSEAAAPITLGGNNPVLSFPDSSPEAQAQAELFRRWMRHALPLHPDVLATLRGAPAIPETFSYFVISPDSPSGRREVWTLQGIEPVEDGFRLEEGLTAHAGPPTLLMQTVFPIAARAAQQAEAPGEDAFLEAIAAYREEGDLARAYLVTFQESSRNGPCPPPGQTGMRDVCREVSSLVAAGIGNSGFESVFAAVTQIGGEEGEVILETLSPYLEEDTLAGAAARTIVANELLAWAVRDPDGPPEDLNPHTLLAEALVIDPFAGANYRYLGNAILTLRNPVGAWTVFDAGRAVPGAARHPMLLEVGVQEERLQGLAPDFFLPR
ncbi:hypothetical protein V0U79_03435 [Hyphobacterium sp. HN65]|uniref:Uncharacterized protein n=1 Tax=Hyphobacterium lacteum TaxID=3116575 RepID=A0ABU7LP53_9PROT|nr:hypothetical protein [Hyphobacterium sp. HN65]MEE2525406.1 hypothetical protein [Hyphobacterium sp. HN65]